MGMDFINDAGQSFHISGEGWTLALRVAEDYGWKPEGTKLEWPDWSGDYGTNSGQRVTESDALSLAEACERAVTDPHYLFIVSSIKRRINAELAREEPRLAPLLNQSREELEFKINLFHKSLKELVVFCRAGSFIIY